jgi:hypothetical protein
VIPRIDRWFLLFPRSRPEICQSSRPKGVIEECTFFRCQCFEWIRPVQKLLPCYNRILHIPALNPVEKDSNRRIEIVQLDRNFKFSGSNPQ